MSVRIDVRFDTGPAAEALGRMADAFEDATPAMRAIGTGMVANAQLRFRHQRGPDGVVWKRLNPDYEAGRPHGAGILRVTGALFGSLTFETTPRSVEVGTNAPHALIHQAGGTIVPKTGSHLVFTVGGRTVFAKSVTIPARPYLGIGPEDEETIMDVIEGALDRASGRT